MKERHTVSNAEIIANGRNALGSLIRVDLSSSLALALAIAKATATATATVIAQGCGGVGGHDCTNSKPDTSLAFRATARRSVACGRLVMCVQVPRCPRPRGHLDYLSPPRDLLRARTKHVSASAHAPAYIRERRPRWWAATGWAESRRSEGRRACSGSAWASQGLRKGAGERGQVWSRIAGCHR